MRYIISFLLLNLTMAAVAQVYISRDANGNVMFSDKPSANSEIHEVKEMQTVPALVIPTAAEQSTKQKNNDQAFEYTSLSIITPNNEQTIPTGHAGNVEVSGVLSPGLKSTDTIYLLNNKAIVREGRQTTFIINNMPRGEHKLQLVVRNKDGKDLISSNPVTIYVQRASTLNRKNTPTTAPATRK